MQPAVVLAALECVGLATAAVYYTNGTSNGISSSILNSATAFGSSSTPRPHSQSSSEGRLASWILNGLGGGQSTSTSGSVISSSSSSNGTEKISHIATQSASSTVSSSRSPTVYSDTATSFNYTSQIASTTIGTGTTAHRNATVTPGPTSPANHSMGLVDYAIFDGATFSTNCSGANHEARTACYSTCVEYQSQCSDLLTAWTSGASSVYVSDYVETRTGGEFVYTVPKEGAEISTIPYTYTRTWTPLTEYSTTAYSTGTQSDSTHTSVYTLFSTYRSQGDVATTYTDVSTYERIEDEPSLSTAEQNTITVTSMVYSYINPTAPKRPCSTFTCDFCNPLACTIQGGEVELLYWPVATQIESVVANSTVTTVLPVTYDTPPTAVYEGTTLVYPTVYISFQTAYAVNDCKKTIGGTYPGAIVGLPPDHLSSIRGDPGPKRYASITTSWNAYWEEAPFNFTNLAMDPVPISVYLDQRNCSDEFCQIQYEGYRPNLAVPMEVFDLDPAWSSCEVFWEGLVDPPVALHQADGIAGVTKPADNGAPPVTTPVEDNQPTPTTPATPCITPVAPTAQPTEPPDSGTRPSASTSATQTRQPKAQIESSDPGPLETPQDTGVPEASGRQTGPVFGEAPQADNPGPTGAAEINETGLSRATPAPELAATNEAPSRTQGSGLSSGDAPSNDGSETSSGSDSGRNNDDSNEGDSGNGGSGEPDNSGKNNGKSEDTSSDRDDQTTSPPVARPAEEDNDNDNDNNRPATNAIEAINEPTGRPTNPDAGHNAEDNDPQAQTTPGLIFEGSNGEEHTAIPDSAGNGVIVDGTATAAIGATVTVAGNDPIVVDSSGIRQGPGGSFQPFTSAVQQAEPTTQRITFEGNTYTVVVPGSPATAAPTQDAAVRPIITAGGEQYTVVANDESDVTVQGAHSTIKLSPGDTETLGGQEVRVDESGDVFVNDQLVNTPADRGAGVSTVQQEVVVTAGSSVYTAAVGDEAGVVQFGQGSLSVGGSATTVHGVQVSLASDGLVVASGPDSMGTIPFASSPTGHPEAVQVQAQLTLGSSTATAYQVAGSPGVVVIDSTTLVVGGPGVTISGTAVSVASTGIVLAGTSTATFDTITLNGEDSQASELAASGLGAWTAMPESLTQVGAALTIGSGTVTAFQASGSPGVVIVDGTKVFVGGDGITIDGVVVSAASSGVVEDGTLVRWTTTTVDSDAGQASGLFASSLGPWTTGPFVTGTGAGEGSSTPSDGPGSSGESSPDSAAPGRLGWSMALSTLGTVALAFIVSAL